MKFGIRYTNQFKKDVQRVKKQGKDLQKLYKVIELIADGQPLSSSFRDHNLSGDYLDFRECHIAPDWLLIYKIERHQLILVLTRTGSHSDLFR